MKDQKYVVSGVSVKELEAAGVDCTETGQARWEHYLIENMVMAKASNNVILGECWIKDGAIYISSDLSRLKEAPTVETAITARISAHEAELDGLYSEADLEVLRPIWRENILKQVFDFIEDGARV